MAGDTVAFFLGAGASVEAGVPDTRGLIRQFKESINDSHVNKFLEALNTWAESHARSLDIELVLATLEQLSHWNEDSLSAFSDPIDIEGINPRELLLKLRDFIKSQVVVQPGKVNYLAPLRGFATTGHPLRIYSANYDTAIELFCAENKLKYRDGFDEEWNPKLLQDKTANIHLIKIHGSVTWYATNRGRFIKIQVPTTSSVQLVTGDRADLLMLYPAQKFEYVEPLFELLIETKKTLETCKTLVVVGYSFRDEHVRRVFWDVARANSDFVVILIAPNARNIYEDRLMNFEDGAPSSLHGRVICFPFLFGKFFPDLQPRFLPNITQVRAFVKDAFAAESRGQQGNWENTLLSAAIAGDYEIAALIYERPELRREFQTVWVMEILIYGMWQAAACLDMERLRRFSDLFIQEWSSMLDKLTVLTSIFNSKNSLVPNFPISLGASNGYNAIVSLHTMFLNFRGEFARRDAWLEVGSANGLLLRKFRDFIEGMEKSLRLWKDPGPVSMETYLANEYRRDAMPGTLKDLLEILKNHSSTTWDGRDRRVELEEMTRLAERAVFKSSVEQLKLLVQ